MSNLTWFKSSYSDNTGGECLEAAFTWRKSSYSDSSGGECVEVATTTAIHIRDSKAPHRPFLTLSSAAWATFLTYVSGA